MAQMSKSTAGSEDRSTARAAQGVVHGHAEAPRSRRSILAAAAAAVLGAVGASLGRPSDAAAADGGTMLIGLQNNSKSPTNLYMAPTDATTAATALSVSSNAQNGSVIMAQSTSTAGKSVGVRGLSNGATGAGVVGEHGYSSTGVYGWSRTSASTTRPTPPKRTGVYGLADQDASALGVLGESSAGVGAKGKSTTGSGVYGTSDSGYGVIGYSRAATAGYFATSAPTTGVALQTVGRVRFDKSVGRATIAAGAASVLVTPGIDLTATSAVVATLQGPAGGAVVERVVVNTTSNTFTIFLTRATTLSVPVAWHAFG